MTPPAKLEVVIDDKAQYQAACDLVRSKVAQALELADRLGVVVGYTYAAGRTLQVVKAGRFTFSHPNL